MEVLKILLICIGLSPMVVEGGAQGIGKWISLVCYVDPPAVRVAPRRNPARFIAHPNLFRCADILQLNTHPNSG